MFIALRPCRFAGKSYRIGDAIEDSVVDPKAVNRLKAEGKIAVVGGEIPSAPPQEPVQEPDEPQEGFIPPETLEWPEEPQEKPEEPQEPTEVLSRNMMEKMNRQNLVDYAASYGIEVDEKMIKREIIEAIIAKRGE